MADRIDFRGTIDGRTVDLYRLENSNGLTAEVTNFGARLVELQVPDSDGNFDNIVVGYDNIPDFRSNENYFGAVIGRYANRISEGKFKLDGIEYILERNEGSHHLHGGKFGFHNAVWGANQTDRQTLELSHRSADGEGGYPGNLGISVTYTLTDEDSLEIHYRAESDEKTVLNVANHAYFNLSGSPGQSVYRHRLMINADQFTPVDQTLIPTGKMVSVEGTPFDFRQLKPIGRDRERDHKQLKYGNGYDHNFILNSDQGNSITHAARVREPDSRRQLDLYTTEPGLQFYECRNPVSNVHSSFCLETQHFPDSPNQPSFPTVVLNPFETFKSLTSIRFTCY